MCRCESFDHKEGRALKNWCFWIVLLEKILESPLDSKNIKPVNPKGNQSWIFIGTIGAEAPYFGHVMWTADSLGKTLMLRKTEGRRRRGQQRMKRLNGITDSMDMNLGKFRETVREREAWHASVYGVTKVTKQQESWDFWWKMKQSEILF